MTKIVVASTGRGQVAEDFADDSRQLESVTCKPLTTALLAPHRLEKIHETFHNENAQLFQQNVQWKLHY